jgi:hypothetical protein
VLTPTQGSQKKAATFPIEARENLVDFWKSFLDTVRAGKGPTASPMDLAYHTQTALIMGMLAFRAQKTAKFDAQKQEIVV